MLALFLVKKTISIVILLRWTTIVVRFFILNSNEVNEFIMNFLRKFFSSGTQWCLGTKLMLFVLFSILGIKKTLLIFRILNITFIQIN